MSAEQNIHVLLVDDDSEFAELVAAFLKGEGGFRVTLRYDGAAGLEAVAEGSYDVIVLDVGMPRMNGFEALKAIRQQDDTPVIMLTARGDDIDRILGLEIGADDYVPKPCNLRELAARIKAIMRRQGRNASEPMRLAVGDIVVEVGSRSVFKNGGVLPLTSTEFMVLEALIESAGEIVDKDRIARHALGRRLMPYDRSVDVHVGSLRKKLGPMPDGRQRIKTVRGRGYLYVTAG